MKRLLVFLCALAVIAAFNPGVSHAAAGETQRTELSAVEVFDLISAAPDAVSMDVDRASTPHDVLRAMSTLSFRTIDVDTVDTVDSALQPKAEEWPRVVSSGIVVPSYDELLQLYQTNADFRQAVDAAAAALSYCTDVVIFIVTIATIFWVLIVLSAVGCVWQLPAVSAWFTCTTNESQRLAGAIIASLQWIVDACSPLASRDATLPMTPMTVHTRPS
ncbi:MAG: hypothetical protein GEU97_24745 [Actinophytocola sp.]|nr:hypothetical protein [Actinophytocola sp.]